MKSLLCSSMKTINGYYQFIHHHTQTHNTCEPLLKAFVFHLLYQITSQTVTLWPEALLPLGNQWKEGAGLTHSMLIGVTGCVSIQCRMLEHKWANWFIDVNMSVSLTKPDFLTELSYIVWKKLGRLSSELSLPPSGIYFQGTHCHPRFKSCQLSTVHLPMYQWIYNKFISLFMTTNQ